MFINHKWRCFKRSVDADFNVVSTEYHRDDDDVVVTFTFECDPGVDDQAKQLIDQFTQEYLDQPFENDHPGQRLIVCVYVAIDDQYQIIDVEDEYF